MLLKNNLNNKILPIIIAHNQLIVIEYFPSGLQLYATFD